MERDTSESLHHSQTRNSVEEIVERNIISWLNISLILTCAVWVSVCSAQTGTKGSTSLLPPRPTLIAVHFPDLSQLEPEVRDHLNSLQESTAAVIKDSGSTNAQL